MRRIPTSSEMQTEQSQGALGLPPSKADLVPGSDGAGIVQVIGANVKDFAIGDRVCTHLTCGLPENELPGFEDISLGLGHAVDGTLRQYGVFHQTSLVKMPLNLSFLQAATLTCSGLTAWNALFGLESKAPVAGSTVLVQGTGGVSIAALQVRRSITYLSRSELTATTIARHCKRRLGNCHNQLGGQSKEAEGSWCPSCHQLPRDTRLGRERQEPHERWQRCRCRRGCWRLFDSTTIAAGGPS